MRATLDELIATQRQKGRTALAQEWNRLRWHYWLRLSWHVHVSATRANEHLERLINDLHRTIAPTVHVVAGFHGDDPQNPHAHALIHLTRRMRTRFLNATEFRDWFRAYWYHGNLWVEDFNVTRQEHGGAVTYLARHPETVVWG